MRPEAPKNADTAPGGFIKNISPRLLLCAVLLMVIFLTDWGYAGAFNISYCVRVWTVLIAALVIIDIFLLDIIFSRQSGKGIFGWIIPLACLLAIVFLPSFTRAVLFTAPGIMVLAVLAVLLLSALAVFIRRR